MAIETAKFGDLYGQSVQLFTLKNRNGISVSLSDCGARLVAINVPDKNGNFDNIVLGFDKINTYIEKDRYIGAVVGRVANRIADATFILNDKVYTLAKNNNGNCLHGGAYGFDFKIWKARILKEGLSPAIKFSYYSCDKEEGFPGNVWVDVVYELTEDNCLLMWFSGCSDKDTLLNLSNHAYFNLLGAGNDILGHTLQLQADYITAIDKFLIPTGELLPVENTPYDFRTPKTIGKDIMQALPGYDHNFVLNEGRTFTAKLSEKTTGRSLEIKSSQPGIQVYTAGHFDGSAIASNGKPMPKFGGVALETQHFPDSIHKSQFPSVVLKVGERYEEQVSYKFGLEG